MRKALGRRWLPISPDGFQSKPFLAVSPGNRFAPVPVVEIPGDGLAQAGIERFRRLPAEFPRQL